MDLYCTDVMYQCILVFLREKLIVSLLELLVPSRQACSRIKFMLDIFRNQGNFILEFLSSNGNFLKTRASSVSFATVLSFLRKTVLYIEA